MKDRNHDLFLRMQCIQALLDYQDIDLASLYSQKRRPTKLWMNNQQSLLAFEEESPHLEPEILCTYFANCRTLMAFYVEDLRMVGVINPGYPVMSDVERSAIVITTQIRLLPSPSNPSFLNKYHS